MHGTDGQPKVQSGNSENVREVSEAKWRNIRTFAEIVCSIIENTLKKTFVLSWASNG